MYPLGGQQQQQQQRSPTRALLAPPQEAANGARLPLDDDLRLPLPQLLQGPAQLAVEVGLVPGVRSEVPAGRLLGFSVSVSIFFFSVFVFRFRFLVG